ncbi:ROK family protein [Paraburkholderia silvatlantica]|uniref:Polyphosphate glucokinase n=1 Tax=Paraburkholderia silvatlantica TaxID=321895 RepID=A0ABR6FJG4_9BURK|nr:ROK family protein [Paraburkholderia silvatlantica]MBB2927577.1 polyphosphate glucokinase [Paraburkholderia silvatlantica]PVY36288.1 polyphosphate glucokinase [Paraburkholderia silvatlantica]PXW40295.1 polyphosphate glucokinase [Paraburkholderia silvatlantica]
MAKIEKAVKESAVKSAVKRAASVTHASQDIENILAIDIGGTGLKAAVIDGNGVMRTERVRVATPHPCPPALLVETLATLVEPLLEPYPATHVSIGFPGFVRNNHVITAPHLGPGDWNDVPLAQMLGERLGIASVRMINDAEMQGLAAIEGQGLEFVMTLGTGVGTAMFRDGELMPHLELAHHPVSKKRAYDEYIGDAARSKAGNKRWNARVEKIIGILDSLVHYDKLWIGGGNAARLAFDLPPNVATVPNDRGIEGGARLWHPRSVRETRQLPAATQRAGKFR